MLRAVWLDRPGLEARTSALPVLLLWSKGPREVRLSEAGKPLIACWSEVRENKLMAIVRKGAPGEVGVREENKVIFPPAYTTGQGETDVYFDAQC